MLHNEIEAIKQIEKLLNINFPETKNEIIRNGTLGYLLDDNKNVIGLGFNRYKVNLFPNINLNVFRNIFQQFKNLKQLSLCCHDITDINGLSELITLETLDLFDNDITDIKPLETLVNLKFLNISWNNKITDYSPLRKLINLEDLRMSKNTRNSQFLCGLMNKEFGLQLKECVI